MVLVTLKAVSQCAKKIYFFIIAAFIVKTLLIGALAVLIHGTSFFAVTLVPWVLIIANLSAVLVFIFLTLRSSVKRKSCDYYTLYWVPALKLFLALSVLIGGLRYATGYYYWWVFLGPIVTWGSFFFLDMGPSNNCNFGARCSCLGYAVLRAFKMAWYNLPIYCVVLFCFSLIRMSLYLLAYYVLYYLIDLSIELNILLLLPIEAAFYSNIYIKLLHEQFDLYFSSGVQKEV